MQLKLNLGLFLVAIAYLSFGVVQSDLLDKNDPCDSSPCKNNGNCTPNGMNGFTCQCLHGFIGESCENFDPCDVNPCRNNGICTATSDSYVCSCADGYLGNDCETKDPCIPSPCLNSGQCSIVGNSFRCSCINGFSGSNCEISPNPCASEPCANAGTCTSSGLNQFNCECKKRYSGPTCEIFENPCIPNPCTNNAICFFNKEIEDIYSCACSVVTGSESCAIPNANTALAGVPTGKLQVAILWYETVDFDLYVVEPNGNEISYLAPENSATGANLDAEADGRSSNKVESISWTNPDSGHYKIKIARMFSKALKSDVKVNIVVINNLNVEHITATIPSTNEVEVYYEFDV